MTWCGSNLHIKLKILSQKNEHLRTDYTVGQNILLPVKIQGDSCCFDFAESEFDNQIAQTPINANGRGLNLINHL